MLLMAAQTERASDSPALAPVVPSPGEKVKSVSRHVPNIPVPLLAQSHTAAKQILGMTA